VPVLLGGEIKEKTLASQADRFCARVFNSYAKY
jgi:hypothetical protein